MERSGPVEGHVVLDVGGDVGALVLYTDARFDEMEIEISPMGEEAARVHTAIHRRDAVGVGKPVYAGIFPDLKAGPYRIWTPEPGLRDHVTIVGGEIAEVDWRIPEDPSRGP